MHDRNRLGIVHQSDAERATLRVREMVPQYAAYCEDPWDVDELLSMTDLASTARSRIGVLSGAQRRRVDVALGIVARPRLVLLDESTTGFDPAARRDFWDLIRELRRRGATIVLTSHYLEEIEILADRVAVIRSGRIMAEGTLEEVRRAHGTEATVSWPRSEGHQRRTAEDPTPLLRELLAAPGPGLHMFMAFPLVWVLLPTFGSGLVLTLLLGAGRTIVNLLGAGDAGPTETAIIVATGGGTTLFSIMLAWWIWRLEVLSHERRQLAAELSAAVRARDESTVTSPLLRVFAKLRVDDRTRAVTFALERRLL